jgi:hypothetical protein
MTDWNEIFNPPLQHPIPKETKVDGDGTHCKICKANTVYEGKCTVCHFMTSKIKVETK